MEPQTMKDIYTNAFLTIVAAEAADPTRAYS